MLSSMTDTLMCKYEGFDIAQDMWITLKDKFGGTSTIMLKRLAIKFDTYRKSHNHYMRQHLREMSNMIRELKYVGHTLTDEQQIQVVIRSLPNSWENMKINMTHNDNIKTFNDIPCHVELKDERLKKQKRLETSVALLLLATIAMSFRGLTRPNATSGMGVDDNSKNTFMELKRKKFHRYVIFKIEEKKKEVVVEKTGGPAESYDDFTASLPDNDCRYAVYDYDFVTSDNCQKSKIFFIAWSPSTSRIRSKMLYATSKDRIRRELDGIHYEIQATDPTEMDLEVLRDRAN
ncbi:hypothetical protein LWI28_010049 [Acer negundo]|uniref:ADF-H domain-containing protein n=1 Tax=Acer negundo TaxID=4023 RepID=A0AAD5IYQ9_ACENE|nr:hypothetical protein LWI28_010049 [Acer negundo]